MKFVADQKRAIAAHQLSKDQCSLDTTQIGSRHQ
jgi:hypothetical protein